MIRGGTIVAIATPPGEGGVGIVRLSGEQAVSIASVVFDGRLRNRRAVFGRIVDAASGEIVDEALAIAMQSPHTYTREDVVELQTHGGPLVLRRTVELCLRAGARMAEPGEFTLRAFLNGRLDLAQAEAVLDVIKARTDASLRLAVQGLGGGLSGHIRDLRAQIVELLAYLSARLDFPDDDVPPRDITPELDEVERALRETLATAEHGMILRQGLRIVLAGRPNVGKSSLLNRLLRADRAIVTATAGTTRDTLEETANVCGVPLILIDTAGLGESHDVVEQLGIARSRAAITQGDALLLVLEAGRSLDPEEHELLSASQGQPRVVVLNKIDLAPGCLLPPSEAPDALLVSALTGSGLAALEQRLADLATGGVAGAGGGATIANPRHKDALERALAQLLQAQTSVRAGMPEDFVSIDLRAAVAVLGEITGQTVTDDLLDSIFRNFCIGK